MVRSRTLSSAPPMAISGPGLPAACRGSISMARSSLNRCGMLARRPSRWRPRRCRRQRRRCRSLRHGQRGRPARRRRSTWAWSVRACRATACRSCLGINDRHLGLWGIVRGSPGKSEETAMASTTGDGLVTKPSNHSVDQTLEKLESMLRAKGVTVFAVIDHSGEAAKVGIEMPSTKLLIFGNPKAGTPLMLAAPSSAIDLPLKILIWADAQGKVWVTYNSPAYLQQRHHLPSELLPNIAVVEALAAKAAE